MLSAIVAAVVVLHLSASVNAQCAYHNHNWNKAMGFCSQPKSSVSLGDFNGDGRLDLLCHDQAGRLWLSFAKKAGTFEKTDYFRPHGWCPGTNNEILVGDFNGDRTSDLLCHNRESGDKKILYSVQGASVFGKEWKNEMKWCYGNTALLLVGDFNGDGRSDLLCHSKANGEKWISLANTEGQFKGTDWNAKMGWCYGKNDQIFVGDFDGNEKDDLLCHTPAGDNHVALANDKGQFTGTTWSGIHRWCGPGTMLLTGDFNADGRTDILCHRYKDGYKWISYTLPLRHFATTDWQRNMQWCSHAGSRVLIGDFNGDGMDDIMCHDNAGRKWIVYAECA